MDLKTINLILDILYKLTIVMAAIYAYIKFNYIFNDSITQMHIKHFIKLKKFIKLYKKTNYFSKEIKELLDELSTEIILYMKEDSFSQISEDLYTLSIDLEYIDWLKEQGDKTFLKMIEDKNQEILSRLDQYSAYAYRQAIVKPEIKLSNYFPTFKHGLRTIINFFSETLKKDYYLEYKCRISSKKETENQIG